MMMMMMVRTKVTVRDSMLAARQPQNKTSIKEEEVFFTLNVKIREISRRIIRTAEV